MTIEHMNVLLGEIKLAEPGADAKEMTFAGYAAIFGNVDSVGDVLEPGAFAATLKDAKASGNWPAMLTSHNGYSMPTGVWTDMKEDQRGLWVEGKLANTERGREVYELLKMQPRPALSGLSIGYFARDYTLHQRTKAEEPRRKLKTVDLFEVSFVTFPANSKARVVSVKSEFQPREVEDGLREAGLSRADSVKAVAVFKSLLQRDAGEPESDPRDEEAAAERDGELKSLADRIRALAK
jgi:HK97 family phage prohead protease